MIRRKTIAAWLLAIVLLPVLAQAADVCLAWDPNTKADLAGYKINYGLASGSYTASVDVGKVTSATISNLSESRTYYFSASAYNTQAVSSGYSNEVSYSVPMPNRSPSIPATPSGPSSSLANASCTFSISAADPDGQALQYRYDWGAGAVSSWGQGTQSHSWAAAGSYCVKAKASDFLLTSGWSACRTLTVAVAAAPKDSDGDGLSDELEIGTYGTNPNAADSGWKRVSFARPFSKPVVVVGGLSANAPSPPWFDCATSPPAALRSVSRNGIATTAVIPRKPWAIWPLKAASTAWRKM